LDNLSLTIATSISYERYKLPDIGKGFGDTSWTSSATKTRDTKNCGQIVHNATQKSSRISSAGVTRIWGTALSAEQTVRIGRVEKITGTHSLTSLREMINNGRN